MTPRDERGTSAWVKPGVTVGVGCGNPNVNMTGGPPWIAPHGTGMENHVEWENYDLKKISSSPCSKNLVTMFLGSSVCFVTMGFRVSHSGLRVRTRNLEATWDRISRRPPSVTRKTHVTPRAKGLSLHIGALTLKGFITHMLHPKVARKGYAPRSSKG